MFHNPPPSSPTVGQQWTPGAAGSPTYIWTGEFWGGLSAGTGREPVRFTPAAGATSVSLAYQVGAEMVFRNGVLLERGVEYTATDGANITFATGFIANEQVAVVPFHVITTLDAVRKDAGLSDLADKGAGRSSLQLDRFNRPRNRLVNSFCWLNQRSASYADNGFVVDRWRMINLSFGSGLCRGTQVALSTPGGSLFRLRGTVITAQASLTGGEICELYQIVEGVTVTDARLGFADAKQLILRMGVRSSVAGTFGVSICNEPATRSWLSSITIAPGEVGQDLVKSFVIPAVTDGVWETGTSVCMHVRVALAVGPTYRGPLGWSAGNFVGPSTQTNLMATVGATFDLFDVGLYVDHAGNGIVPPYETPDYATELARCQRYYQLAPVNLRAYSAGNGALYGGTVLLAQPMRTSPTVGAAQAMPGTNGTLGNGLTSLTVPYISPSHIDFLWAATIAGDVYSYGYGVPLNAEF